MISTSTPLLETSLDGLTLHRRGKVRDVYEVGDQLLIVATDRISAFDYVLGSGIPDKGKVLTQLSGFWFERMGDLVPHHLISMDVGRCSRPRRARTPTCCAAARCWCGAPSRCRSSASRAATCRDRAGRNTSRPARVCGIALPSGLRESDRLPEPIFTPATKAESGHDENISEEEAARGWSAAPLVDAAQGADARDLSARRRARGIEGHHHRRHQVRVRPGRRRRPGTDVVLIDEVLTPDSSRFWPQAQYEPGQGQPSFDKQFVRDYLEADPLEQAAAGAVAARRCRAAGRARSTSRRSACSRDGSCSSARARSTRTARPGDARQGHPLRRRAARVREDVHRAGAAALEGQRRRRRELLGLHRNTIARKMTRIPDQADLTVACPRSALEHSGLSAGSDRLVRDFDGCHDCQPSFGVARAASIARPSLQEPGSLQLPAEQLSLTADLALSPRLLDKPPAAQ